MENSEENVEETKVEIQEENQAEVAKVIEETSKQEEATYVEPQQRTTNVVGLVSFIFAMIALFIFGLPFSVVAIITGIIGIATFKKDTQKNRWMGITGLSVGAVELVVMLLYYAIQ
ncbi:MAG: hypothetical protein ACLTEH_04970 [Clostridia bacterium]